MVAKTSSEPVPPPPEESKRSVRARRFLGRYPFVCGGFAILAGAVVLAGWWLDLSQLTSIIPGLPPMVANTALMVALTGASLLLLAPAAASRPRSAAGKLSAGGAGLIAGLTLAEYVFGWDLQIDQLLAATGEALVARYPGRSSPQTIAAVLLAAMALLTLERRTARGRRPAELLALASGLIPLAALLGYLFEVAPLYGPSSLLPYTGMSILTAVVLLALSTGIVAARAEVGVLSVLAAEDSGGIAARQLVAWLLVLVPLVCAIAIGPRMGWYSAPLASAGIVLAGFVAGSTFVLLISRRLSQVDAKRREGDESRFRLASLVDSADEAIIAKTLEGIILDWNSAAERIYGYPAAEVVGRSVYQLVPADRVEELRGILEAVRRGEGVRSLETVRRRKDGSTVPVLVTMSPIVDSEGRIRGASTISHDITERKRAEEALRKARDTERLLRAELEELGRASVAVSEAVADLSQSDVSAVLSMIALQAQSLTHADYVALGIGTDPAKPFDPWIFLGMSPEVARSIGRFPRPVGTLGRVAREGEVIHISDVHHHHRFRGLPPGHPEMASLLGVPINYRGRAMGNLYLANKPGSPEFSEQDERLIRMLAVRVGAAIETATLYAAEDLQRTWLQNMIDQMPDGVLLYDEQGRLKAMNQTATALSCEETGRTDPFGNPVTIDARGLDGSPIPMEQWPIVRVLRHQEGLVHEEWLLRRRAGDLLPVAVSAAPVRDATGKISGAMAIFQDISARKELERLREEWGAVVAHDLRQPVSTITLAAESLLKARGGQLPDKERRTFERIRSASGRLNRMINDLLDASRIESKRLVVECREVDLGALIDAVADGLDDVLAGHDLRVIVEPEQLAWIDPDRIHQVLANLLSNAVKYGQAGTEIRVEAIPRGDAVEVIVTNRGPGIPPEQLDLLFSRFTRARGARESRTPGLGLGLYIAKGLVEAHGGRLWAESTPGETTSFHFTVPRAPSPTPFRGETASHAPS